MEPQSIGVVVYFTSYQEIHMVSDIVGVCWNTREEISRREEVDDSGKRTMHVITTVVRKGDPYIIFATMREYGDGAWERDDDSPVDGGFDIAFADKIRDGLLLASNYMRQLA